MFWLALLLCFRCGINSAGASVIREGSIPGHLQVEGIRICGNVIVPGAVGSSGQLMRNAVTCPSR